MVRIIAKSCFIGIILKKKELHNQVMEKNNTIEMAAIKVLTNKSSHRHTRDGNVKSNG